MRRGLTSDSVFVGQWCSHFLLPQDSNEPKMHLTLRPKAKGQIMTDGYENDCISWTRGWTLALHCMLLCTRHRIEPFIFCTAHFIAFLDPYYTSPWCLNTEEFSFKNVKPSHCCCCASQTFPKESAEHTETEPVFTSRGQWGWEGHKQTPEKSSKKCAMQRSALKASAPKQLWLFGQNPCPPPKTKGDF